MYSFNLDYIFNLFYNLLLALRYVWLFWILRISSDKYLSDHESDAWDGLRDRGWIHSSQDLANSLDLNSANLSWWDFIKEKIFGINIHNLNTGKMYGSDLSGINNGDTLNLADRLNADNAGLAVTKTNNSLFSGLHFSIQNPVLSFMADVLTIFAFFIFLILIYSFLSWLWLEVGDKFKTTDKKYEEKKEKIKKIEEKNIAGKKVKHVYTFDEKLNLTEEQKLEKIKQIEDELRLLDVEDNKRVEAKLIKEERGEISSDDIPAGIAGLPIDMSQFDEGEKVEIKNIFEKENLENQNLKDWRERWERVGKYMEGEEEALWRIAILEADNLLSDLLIDRGYEGVTVAEKLQNAKFRTIELAWEAHRMRNRIAHDGAKFVLAEKVARKNIAMFEAVLMEFKVLD